MDIFTQIATDTTVASAEARLIWLWLSTRKGPVLSSEIPEGLDPEHLLVLRKQGKVSYDIGTGWSCASGTKTHSLKEEVDSLLRWEGLSSKPISVVRHRWYPIVFRWARTYGAEAVRVTQIAFLASIPSDSRFSMADWYHFASRRLKVSRRAG